MPIYVTLAGSPALVSSAFALGIPQRGVAIEVPSLSPAVDVRLEFTAGSGTGPFASFRRPDGTGAPWVVFSGTGAAFGVVPHPPTPFGRLVVTSGQLDVRTFTLHATRR